MTSTQGKDTARSGLVARSRAQRGELMRKEIVAAAIVEIAERGYHETSLAKIAKRLGVSTGTIYNYFTDKRQILEHAVDESLATVAGLASTLISEPSMSGQSAKKRSERLADVIAELIVGDPQTVKMLLVIASITDPELRARWTGANRIVIAGVQQYLDAGIANGTVRADINTEATATAIIAIPAGIIACNPDLNFDIDHARAITHAAIGMVISGIFLDTGVPHDQQDSLSG